MGVSFCCGYGLACQPPHVGGGDDLAVADVGLDVVFDVLRLVLIIDHQAERLGVSLGGGVGQVVDALDAGAVAEVKARDGIVGPVLASGVGEILRSQLQ